LKRYTPKHNIFSNGSMAARTKILALLALAAFLNAARIVVGYEDASALNALS